MTSWQLGEVTVALRTGWPSPRFTLRPTPTRKPHHDRSTRSPGQRSDRRSAWRPCWPSSAASSSARTTPLRLALACLLARGHLLIEDIPGVGKSTLAQALAATLGLTYARVQFTSDLLPADVLGVSIFDAQTQAFRFHPGPDLQFGRARRRNQPRAAEDAKRAARSDGGAPGLAGRRRRARCPIRSSSSRPRTPSSRSAPIRCPNRSSTAS